MHQIPPFAALRALEAVARHLSFTRAAAELNITQSAVSHQIRHVEELWGLKLFERLPRSLRLTAAGERLAPMLRGFFVDLDQTITSLKAAQTRHSLNVWVFPSFALKWLVPRLHRFRVLHPEIDVWITTQKPREAVGQFDVYFELREGPHPTAASWRLMSEYVYPVARPEFVRDRGMPHTPADLCRYPLLLRAADPGAPQWEFWFARAGVPPGVYGPALSGGTRFPDSATALQAALEGEGVALIRSATAWDDLASGRIVRLLNVRCPFHRAVYLVSRERSASPARIAFRDWLMDESARAQADFDAAETGGFPG